MEHLNHADKPLVSVILPTHNCAGFISEAIESVQAQTYTHWELIICDDGSTDNTAEVVARFAGDSRVRYLPLDKQNSVYRVRNLGIAQSHGAYIAFLDADDVFSPDHLENLLTALETKPDMLWAYDFYTCMNEAGQPIVNQGVNLVKHADGHWVVPVTSAHTWRNILEGKCVSILQNVMLRRSCFEQVGPFFEEATHAFDTQYIHRLFLQGLDKAYAHPSYGVVYRIHAKGITKNSALVDKLLQSRLKVPEWLQAQTDLPRDLKALVPYLFLLVFLRVARLQLFEGRAGQVFQLFGQAIRHPHIAKGACLTQFLPLLCLACVPQSLYRLVFNTAKASINFYGQVLTRLPLRKASALLMISTLAVGIWVAGSAQAEPPKGKTYTLTFSDEFDGVKLNPYKWHTTYPHNRRTTPTNNEKQWYVDDAAVVKGGMLQLVAKKSKLQVYPYTSGMVASWGLFDQQYGYFESRMKLPKGKGLWSGFWLMPGNLTWPPEIDIAEYLGDDAHSRTMHMTNHYKVDNKMAFQAGKHVDVDYSQAFHVYGLLWEPNKLTWYIDGMPRFTSTQGLPQMPMYLIANLAVGGNWPGDPDRKTRFPATMLVDYIRVYTAP